MNNDLREQVAKIIDSEYTKIYNNVMPDLVFKTTDELITLIRTATLDAMQAEIDEIEKSELWAQMGIPAECHGVYIEKFEEAIDNLRGNDE